MHRIMYSREIFTGLKGYLLFFLVVGKDFMHSMSRRERRRLQLLLSSKKPFRFLVLQFRL